MKDMGRDNKVDRSKRISYFSVTTKELHYNHCLKSKKSCCVQRQYYVYDEIHAGLAYLLNLQYRVSPDNCFEYNISLTTIKATPMTIEEKIAVTC